MFYTQDQVKSLNKVGITLEDALQMGLGIRDANDIKRESLENRAFSGYPALSLEEECVLAELRLEKMTGERFTGVDLIQDERTHRDNHYDGQDETPVKGEFLQDGDQIRFSSDFEVRRSRDGKKLLFIGVTFILIIGISKKGGIYQLVLPNKR